MVSWMGRAWVGSLNIIGKNKKVFSRSSRYGYFEIDLPISMKNAKAKVKINCNGKRITKGSNWIQTA